MKQEQNMICDLETGICGTSGEDTPMEFIDLSQPKATVDLYYVTDPICSHCWALEPVLRKLKLQYGRYFKMHTLMGGLLEKWDGFADVANGITGPSDVAEHWREVGEHSRMPIDGSLWLEDPVESSFIPSRVYKVIQKKEPQLADVFLRRARESLFPFNQNIAQDEVLTRIVNEMGLNGEEIVQLAKQPAANEALQEDFRFVRQLGVRGFPTIVLLNEEKKGVKLVGARSLDQYVAVLEQAMQGKTIYAEAIPPLAQLLKDESVLFSREIEELYGIFREDVDVFIKEQLESGTFEMDEVLGEVYVMKK